MADLSDFEAQLSSLARAAGGQASSLGQAVGSTPVLQVDPMAQGMLQRGASPAGITGHAASPANFDTFDSKFIGTGMGHNYNGQGFYFSANPGYASAMRQQYFPQGKVYTTQINAQPHEMFNLDAKAIPGTVDAIDKDLGAKVLGEVGDRFREMSVRAGRVTNRDVLNALEDVDTNTYRKFFGDYTISTAQQGASRYLGAAGYKGNTYSDSYGQHYVVYDPKDIAITNKQ